MAACLLALLSLELGQDIFVSTLQGRKRVEEVSQTHFSNSKIDFLDSFELVLALFFCLKPELTQTTAHDCPEDLQIITSSTCLSHLKVLHHVYCQDPRQRDL